MAVVGLDGPRVDAISESVARGTEDPEPSLTLESVALGGPAVPSDTSKDVIVDKSCELGTNEIEDVPEIGKFSVTDTVLGRIG